MRSRLAPEIASPRPSSAINSHNSYWKNNVARQIEMSLMAAGEWDFLLVQGLFLYCRSSAHQAQLGLQNATFGAVTQLEGGWNSLFNGVYVTDHADGPV